MKILFAEDDIRLGKLVTHMLKKEGKYHAEWVNNGNEALFLASNFYYDLIILDWMMPEMDGVTVCRELRKKGYNGAILILTAKDFVSDKVEGLDAGADDFLVKPFEFEELFARIRALSRRGTQQIKADIIQYKDILLNRTTFILQIRGKEIQLTPTEFQLLDLLIINQGCALTREVIHDRVWGYDSDVNYNTIDAFIRILRKKIDDTGYPSLIKSIRGVGYRIE